MSRFAALLCSCRVPHVATLALISIGFAGCSADMSTRFTQGQGAPGQSGKFGWPREATGSVAATTPPAPVERQEPPQYARPQPYQSSAMPPIAAPQSYPTGGVSGGGRGLASYAPPTHAPLETTGTVAPRSV